MAHLFHSRFIHAICLKTLYQLCNFMLITITEYMTVEYLDLNSGISVRTLIFLEFQYYLRRILQTLGTLTHMAEN